MDAPDDPGAIWSITRARDAAWVRAEIPLRLRGKRELSDACLEVNDRPTKLAGRALLLPLP